MWGVVGGWVRGGVRYTAYLLVGVTFGALLAAFLQMRPCGVPPLCLQGLVLRLRCSEQADRLVVVATVDDDSQRPLLPYLPLLCLFDHGDSLQPRGVGVVWGWCCGARVVVWCRRCGVAVRLV